MIGEDHEEEARRIVMTKRVASAALSLGLAASALAVSTAQESHQIPPACLHGPSEVPAQRARRDQALKLALQINRAEHGAAMPLPGQRTREYRPPAQLPNIPPVPAGFRLQFYTDGPTYTFSLKDTTDRCEFAYFSDQDQGIYEGTPQTAARVVPLGTR
jgi:hypothetical protein